MILSPSFGEMISHSYWPVEVSRGRALGSIGQKLHWVTLRLVDNVLLLSLGKDESWFWMYCNCTEKKKKRERSHLWEESRIGFRNSQNGLDNITRANWKIINHPPLCQWFHHWSDMERRGCCGPWEVLWLCHQGWLNGRVKDNGECSRFMPCVAPSHWVPWAEVVIPKC